ncbi:sensor histidine kinase [Chitinophaga nivalis]|uniref:histidine kinase n=1 Tax=Chitinophaga nivalis TaxID=2991709 RepID=A0ABT3IQB5_9BACT|nr:ATP-binding protein [Chitinophaga nivalis]MCW3464155.1 ATP-binding protein [Chitinophaga nivalis]MCW3486155.1 ATP-binding protein [Chitinophaga nivalis]
MTIRSKLTLLFTLLFAALLLAFAIFIYVSSAATREDEYYKRLQQQAITKANLLLGAEVAPEVLQVIYKNSPNALFQEEVAIYDTTFHLLYHDAVHVDKIKETGQMIQDIIREKEIQFTQGELQAVGILYHFKGRNYVITAAARDEYGFTKLQNLRYTLIISFCLAIILTIIIGYFFARKALQPVADIVDKVEDITATNLDSRLPVNNEKDEIGELAVTFNHMLNRLESSFDAQKQFVSNVSHELRTPLAIIITELELALTKERSQEAYKQAISSALQDAQRLARLSNGLLNLAKASYDQREISMKTTRLDELLLDAREMVIKANEDYKVNILFEQEIENDDYISVTGNAYLLKVAFVNLMENGCKFSANRQSQVAISWFGKNVILRFADTGIGIPDEELPHIFQPFYRGGNKQFAEGHGIGLSLTQKIVLLHKGTIQVASQPGAGTTFTVEMPHV